MNSHSLVPPHEDADSLLMEVSLWPSVQLVGWCQGCSVNSEVTDSCSSWAIALLKRGDHKASVSAIGSI